MNNLFESISILFLLQISSIWGQRTGDFKCLTPDKKIGKCVILRECKDLLMILNSKSNDPNTTQFLRDSQCGNTGNQPKVCCSTGVSFVQSDLPGTETCGQVEPRITSRIVGGEGVQLGDYPWMAVLGYRRKNKPGPEWLCGGSLINSKYVLTVGSCVSDIGQYKLFVVRIGDLDLNESVEDGASPQDIMVEYEILHEGYTKSPVTNDIALVKLSTPAQFTSYVKPICLPVADELRSYGFENQFVYVSGWGRTNSSGGDSRSSLLQHVKLPILDIKVCKQAFSSFSAIKVDFKNHICAGFLSGKKDSCQGDSGGPLMWVNPEDSKYYLIGIVSYGFKCATPGFPGIYSRVSEYVDWIQLNAS